VVMPCWWVEVVLGVKRNDKFKSTTLNIGQTESYGAAPSS
jgi:hypothetical protein